MSAILKMNAILEATPPLLFSKSLPKPTVALVKDKGMDFPYQKYNLIYKDAYWPRYERFLIANGVNYRFVDINCSDWQEQLRGCEALIWRVDSDPATLSQAKPKIYFIQNFLGVKCFPSFKEIWHYEDKGLIHYILRQNRLPEIPVFFSFSKQESIDYLKGAKYPMVFKITNGSSSMNVEKVSSKKQAMAIVELAFGRNGRKTGWPYLRQKNYIYAQEFIEQIDQEVRIILAGEKIFGYYKEPKSGDFRASGSGIVKKGELPSEAMDIAREVRDVFDSEQLVVDLVSSKRDNKFMILEVSFFIRIITSEQLKVDDVAGYYVYDGDNYHFTPGKYWIQELALMHFFER